MVRGRFAFQPRRVFVDSSAYLAIGDRRDEHHDEALTILRELTVQRYRISTASTIIIEAYALILSSLGGDRARQFLLDMDTGPTRVFRVRARDEVVAREILFRYTDKMFSFTDAISFVMMERHGIRLAFTLEVSDGCAALWRQRLCPVRLHGGYARPASAAVMADAMSSGRNWPWPAISSGTSSGRRTQ